MKPIIPDNILALIEHYVDEANKQVGNKRPEVAPTDLTELFTNNPETKFFKVISKNLGVDKEHNFSVELITNPKTNKPTSQAKIKDLKSNCEDLRNLGTLLYGNTFGIDFGGCGMTKIDKVVMIKTYADQNGQPLDEYPIDYDEGEPLDKRIDSYYNIMKGLKVGEYAHFDQAGTVNKYDGEVIRHEGNAMQLTMSKHGSKKEFNLNINLEQNPFYIEDHHKIMFKGEATTPKDFETSEDNVDRKPFIIEVKRFDTTNEAPKPKKGEKKAVAGDEEKLKSDGKKAMDAILNDPLLKQAFYKQPSLWNLFKAELQGKKAAGTGILPTLQLVGDYQKKKLSERLGAEFIEGKLLHYRLTNQKVSIPYTNRNGDRVNFVREKDTNYIAKVATHELGADTTLNGYDDSGNVYYQIIIRKKTDIANVFICDFIKKDETNERNENVEKGIQITLAKSDKPDYGYKPSFKEEPKK
jgi:hypothetical protein